MLADACTFLCLLPVWALAAGTWKQHTGRKLLAARQHCRALVSPSFAGVTCLHPSSKPPCSLPVPLWLRNSLAFSSMLFGEFEPQNTHACCFLHVCQGKQRKTETAIMGVSKNKINLFCVICEPS